MKIAISGATGFVGSALAAHLKERGHDVITVVRTKPHGNQIRWDPEKDILDPKLLDGVDAVINLSGENVAARWTEERKDQILQSRIAATRTWVEAIKKMAVPSKVFINASAIGYYGDRKEELLDESSTKGEGFLADVCKRWEEELHPLEKSNVRVAILRFGVILSPNGGALAKMLTPFKFGLGGVVGSGDQYVSWIDLRDVVRAVDHVLNSEALSGPVNVVSPYPITNRDLTKALGKQLYRPTFFPLPAFVAKLVFGQMAEEMLLSSSRVLPKKLSQTDFVYDYPTIESSLLQLNETDRK